VSQLVFKINEEHRVRPQDKKPGTKPAYAHDACNARAYDFFFYFQRNFRVLFANFGNIKHLSHMEISHQIISGNIFTLKKYSFGNQI
jgi:hypothetical protein